MSRVIFMQLLKVHHGEQTPTLRQWAIDKDRFMHEQSVV